jgi:hypothetical protein
MARKARRRLGGVGVSDDLRGGGKVAATITDLGAYRQWRRDADALRQALDHLDALGLCACWVAPRRCPRRPAAFVATGTGAP